jgi:hypothetical protein
LVAAVREAPEQMPGRAGGVAGPGAAQWGQECKKETFGVGWGQPSVWATQA